MTPSSLRVVLAVTISAVVAAVVVIGLLVIGVPGEARLRRLDERRVEHLQGLSRSVAVYWTVNETLPESLSQLSDIGGVVEIPRDPETGVVYRYDVISELRYELCAEFSRSTPSGVHLAAEELWSHAEGSQCFELAPVETER